MKYVAVSIEGISPLVQWNFGEFVENHGVTIIPKDPDPEKRAEQMVYRDKEGEIYEPASLIHSSMEKTGKKFTFEGGKSFLTVNRDMRVYPDCLYINGGGEDAPVLSFNTVSVVIEKMHIKRYKPMFKDWKLDFVICLREGKGISVDDLRQILDVTGSDIGIGEYRPKYGRFKVTGFRVMGTTVEN